MPLSPSSDAAAQGPARRARRALAWWSGRGRPRFGPVDHQPALSEEPLAVLLDEFVEIADGRDHQRTLPVVADREVMGQAVTLAGCPVPVEGHSALAVEVHGGDVGVEVVEHAGQGLAAVPRLGAW